MCDECSWHHKPFLMQLLTHVNKVVLYFIKTAPAMPVSGRKQDNQLKSYFPKLERGRSFDLELISAKGDATAPSVVTSMTWFGIWQRGVVCVCVCVCVCV